MVYLIFTLISEQKALTKPEPVDLENQEEGREKGNILDHTFI